MDRGETSVINMICPHCYRSIHIASTHHETDDDCNIKGLAFCGNCAGLYIHEKGENVRFLTAAERQSILQSKRVLSTLRHWTREVFDKQLTKQEE